MGFLDSIRNAAKKALDRGRAGAKRVKAGERPSGLPPRTKPKGKPRGKPSPSKPPSKPSPKPPSKPSFYEKIDTGFGGLLPGGVTPTQARDINQIKRDEAAARRAANTQAAQDKIRAGFEKAADVIAGKPEQLDKGDVESLKALETAQASGSQAAIDKALADVNRRGISERDILATIQQNPDIFIDKPTSALKEQEAARIADKYGLTKDEVLRNPQFNKDWAAAEKEYIESQRKALGEFETGFAQRKSQKGGFSLIGEAIAYRGLKLVPESFGEFKTGGLGKTIVGGGLILGGNIISGTSDLITGSAAKAESIALKQGYKPSDPRAVVGFGLTLGTETIKGAGSALLLGGKTLLSPSTALASPKAAAQSLANVGGAALIFTGAKKGAKPAYTALKSPFVQKKIKLGTSLEYNLTGVSKKGKDQVKGRGTGVKTDSFLVIDPFKMSEGKRPRRGVSEVSPISLKFDSKKLKDNIYETKIGTSISDPIKVRSQIKEVPLKQPLGELGYKGFVSEGLNVGRIDKGATIVTPQQPLKLSRDITASLDVPSGVKVFEVKEVGKGSFARTGELSLDLASGRPSRAIGDIKLLEIDPKLISAKKTTPSAPFVKQLPRGGGVFGKPLTGKGGLTLLDDTKTKTKTQPGEVIAAVGDATKQLSKDLYKSETTSKSLSPSISLRLDTETLQKSKVGSLTITEYLPLTKKRFKQGALTLPAFKQPTAEISKSITPTLLQTPTLTNLQTTKLTTPLLTTTKSTFPSVSGVATLGKVGGGLSLGRLGGDTSTIGKNLYRKKQLFKPKRQRVASITAAALGIKATKKARKKTKGFSGLGLIGLR